MSGDADKQARHWQIVTEKKNSGKILGEQSEL